jgi:transposase
MFDTSPLLESTQTSGHKEVDQVVVELSVMEQRYQAVMAVVQDGWKVTEVADRLGVARQSVHNWIARYDAGGLAALADRSHRPASCAHQIAPELEALICELRRHHPGWGPRPHRARPRQTRRRPGAVVLEHLSLS